MPVTAANLPDKWSAIRQGLDHESPELATALFQSLSQSLLRAAWRPRSALLLQITVVGARDDATAAREAEALASDLSLLPPTGAGAAAISGAKATRRQQWRIAPDGTMAAFVVDLGGSSGSGSGGPASATRWTSRPR